MNLEVAYHWVQFVLVAIFFTVIWTMLWKIVTAEDMVLESVGKWGEKKVEEGYKIYEGLITCEWCVPNFHGLFIVWPVMFLLGLIDLQWKLFLVYPFCAGGSSLISGLIWQYYLTMNRKKEYYDNASDYYDKAEQEKFMDIKDRKQLYNQNKVKS